jgi:hypothetical protein
VIRIGEARSSVDAAGARVMGRRLALEEVNVSSALSMLAACMAKKALEALGGSGRVEVAIHYYADIDKVLDGREEIEYLEIEVVGSGGGCSEDALREGVSRCPLYGLLRERVRGVYARCGEGENL